MQPDLGALRPGRSVISGGAGEVLEHGRAGDAFGGIDSKNVDAAHVFGQRVLAIGAPSHVYEPVFAWTAEFSGVAHEGMPPVFNFNWTTMYPDLS